MGLGDRGGVGMGGERRVDGGEGGVAAGLGGDGGGVGMGGGHRGDGERGDGGG